MSPRQKPVIRLQYTLAESWLVPAEPADFSNHVPSFILAAYREKTGWFTEEAFLHIKGNGQVLVPFFSWTGFTLILKWLPGLNIKQT